MLIPLPQLDNDILSIVNIQNLERRKGGGGGRGGGGGSRGGGGSSSGGSRGSGSGGSRGSGSSGSRGGNSRNSPSRNKGAPPVFYNSPHAWPFVVVGGGHGVGSALAYADGGGNRFKMSSETAFPGREAGGGTRKDVYGSSRYGSGYPYGSSGSYISGRPFPFVFFPVPISVGYYGSLEYESVDASKRPGGAVLTAVVQPGFNTSAVTYRLVGDNSSVTAVFTALVANCTVANSTGAITKFNASSMTYPLPEQVIQWYRASTFALSLDSYNNSASLRSSMPAGDAEPAPPPSADTPLPVGLNATFLMCLNMTIGASVPLVDPPSRGLSTDKKVAVAMSAVLLVLLACFYCWRKRPQRRGSVKAYKALKVDDIDVSKERQAEVTHEVEPSASGPGMGQDGELVRDEKAALLDDAKASST